MCIKLPITQDHKGERITLVDFTGNANKRNICIIPFGTDIIAGYNDKYIMKTPREVVTLLSDGNGCWIIVSVIKNP